MLFIHGVSLREIDGHRELYGVYYLIDPEDWEIKDIIVLEDFEPKFEAKDSIRWDGLDIIVSYSDSLIDIFQVCDSAINELKTITSKKWGKNVYYIIFRNFSKSCRV